MAKKRSQPVQMFLPPPERELYPSDRPLQSESVNEFYKRLLLMQAERDRAAQRAQAIRELQMQLMNQLNRADISQENLLLQQQKMMNQQ